ncbi:hypothetical protein Ddye_023011 [Dipteronia dyeriana]|uniref:Uncharacterized protein n=1 Tax=Dipteronia dyeriana TaxID=168575 RepID=A0AAD9TSS5_9ROSI|nr:hypothetical protein Ddye_023011 [Dipteronia dyeriana]
MAVAWFKGMLINTLASELYTTGFLKHAYEMGINPVPDPEFWEILDAIQNCIVLPWKKKNLPGRPKMLRIPSAEEKIKVQSCSKCGQKAHNKKTCLEPSCGISCKPTKKARTCIIVRKKEAIDLSAQTSHLSLP